MGMAASLTDGVTQKRFDGFSLPSRGKVKHLSLGFINFALNDSNSLGLKFQTDEIALTPSPSWVLLQKIYSIWMKLCWARNVFKLIYDRISPSTFSRRELSRVGGRWGRSILYKKYFIILIRHSFHSNCSSFLTTLACGTRLLFWSVSRLVKREFHINLP